LTDTSDYQESAGWCVCEAERTDAPEERALLLMMARAWMQLADQTDQIHATRPASAENVS
jgi:hypothetical protein